MPKSSDPPRQRWGPPLVPMPPDTAPSTFPAGDYTDPDRFAREIDRIFQRQWLAIAHGTEIPFPGDYLVWEEFKESVVVARQPDGDLAAFFNVCQHRGTRIAASAGHCEDLLTCPFHGLRYDLRGRLAELPSGCDFGEAQRESMHCDPVAVREWGGLIWINLAGTEAEPLERALDEFVEDLEPFAMSELDLHARRDYSVDCNWKVLIDGFLEAHPPRSAHPDAGGVPNETWFHLFERNSAHYRPLQRSRDRLRETLDHVRFANSHHFVFPATIVDGTLGLMQVYTAVPIDVDECQLTVWNLVAPDLDAPTRDTMDRYWQGVCAAIEESIAIAEELAVTRRSRAYRVNRTSRQELRLPHFHSVVSRMIG